MTNSNIYNLVNMGKNMENSMKSGLILALSGIALLSGCVSNAPLELRDVQKTRDGMRYVSDQKNYGVPHYLAPVNEIIAKGNRDDCDGYAFRVAAEFRKHGYDPLVLELWRELLPLDNTIHQNPNPFGMKLPLEFSRKQTKIAHMVAVCEYGGKFYAIGTGRSEDCYADTIRELVKRISRADAARPWEHYRLFNLDEVFPNGEWINGKGNLADKLNGGLPVAQGVMH